jgi:AAA+ ATPase superfamily predicted ATPase
VLPTDAPFCNRKKELHELLSHARNRANVVIFSPRRYGKTSLVKRIQERLKDLSFLTIYVDLFGVDSVEDMAGRIASWLYSYSHKDESIFKKAMKFLSSWRPVIRPDSEYGVSLSVEVTRTMRGIELLEETFLGFGKFIQEHGKGVHIVFDEFQEISELRESLQLEGLLRSHIQTHSNASYFFVGSRRRVLRDIFNEKKRPFYRSSINYPLGPLPIDESIDFIMEQFKRGGKVCPLEIAKKVVEKTGAYPYNIQRMPYSIFEVSGKRVTEKDYIKGFTKTLEEESIVYEAMIQGLSLQQTKLVSALAHESTGKPYSIEYMARHSLGSIGGVQGALKRLLELDYIEKRGNLYILVDPVFGVWLNRLTQSHLE